MIGQIIFLEFKLSKICHFKEALGVDIFVISLISNQKLYHLSIIIYLDIIIYNALQCKGLLTLMKLQ